MTRVLMPLAQALTVIYLVLAVEASVCLFAHEAPQAGGHHHAGKATHSTLCLWACQANNGSSLTASPPVLVPFLLGLWFVPVPAVHTPSLRLSHARSRAPPR